MDDPITSVEVDSIKESSLSDDGKRTVFGCTQSSGNPLSLTFNHRDLVALINHAAYQFTRGEAVQGVDKSKKTAFPVAAWALDPVEAGGMLLSLTLPDGGTLSFVLDAGSVAQIFEVLGMMLNASGNPGAGTPQH